MQPFTFDVGFQRAVLRLMMIDEGFAVKAQQWLGPEMFTAEPLGWIFRVFQQYWSSYQMRCTELPLRDAVRVLPEGKIRRYSTEVDLVVGLGNVPESAWVRVKLSEFVKQALFARAHAESVAPFNAGDQNRAYTVMATAMERIHEVDFEKVDRSWVFDELRDRQAARIRSQLDPGAGVFSTGLRDLDLLTDGGVHLGELWAVFAYAKRCKTTWLINQGGHATRLHRQPTLHLLLEGRLETVIARYDAWFSGELYTRVKRGEIDAPLYYALEQEYLMMRRMLVVRRLDGWDNTIDDVRAELAFLKTQGFEPKMLITDYADLGRKRDAGKNAGETEHQIGFSRDLKRLHENENIAGWTAWQAQRPPKGAHTREHVLTSSNIADAFAKARIVDAYGSLNATDEEMALGEMRYFHEGHRDAPVNKLWSITNDLARMRMLTSATEYVPREDDAA